VALKTLVRTTPETLYRFKREFRALSDLVHPNLVRLYELLEDKGTWFFTMELLLGQDFIRYVRPGDSLDTDRLRRCLVQLADGLHALHQSGRLHRDVKPTNVMVTEDERVVLLDFGMVTDETGDASRSGLGGVVGTPVYMAPEQAEGGALEPAADWYAVGTMVYEALTGKPPYTGTAMKVLVDKLRHDPTSPSRVAEVPHDLESLCMALLDRDADARPDGPRVRAWAVGATLSVPSRTPTRVFVGRAEELSRLHEAFDRVRRGEPELVHLVGDSGLGKTALLQAFLRELEQVEPAPVVLSGRCYERETVPYKAFDAVLDALSRHLLRLSDSEIRRLVPRDGMALTRLFPVLARVPAIAAGESTQTDDALALRRAAFGALSALLHGLAAATALVISLDDLQWGDADSGLLFHTLFGPRNRPPLLLLCAYRPGPDDHVFLRRIRQAEGRAILIKPLPPEEAEHLAQILLDEEDAPELARRLALDAGGNPMHIAELIRHADAHSSGDDNRLEAVLGRRFDRLPPMERRLLELLSVADGPIPLVVAFSAAGMNPDPVLARGMAEACLIRADAGQDRRVELYHDSIRVAVDAVLSDKARGDLHHRLASALMQLGDPDDDLVALHLHQAGKGEDAAPYVLRAAEQAERALAFGRAAELYGRALSLGVLTNTRGDDVRRRRADAVSNAGRYAEAARLYQDLADLAGADQALALRQQAADKFLRAGRLGEGRAMISAMLKSIGEHLPSSAFRALLSVAWRRLRVRLRGTRFTVRSASEIPTEVLRRVDIMTSVGQGLAVLDVVRSADAQSRSLLLALDAGEPRRIARCMAVEGALHALMGPKGRAHAEALIERSIAIALEAGAPEITIFGHSAAVVSAFHACDWPTVIRRAREALSSVYKSGVGVHWERMVSDMFSLAAAWWLGDLTTFRTGTLERIADARERGDLLAELHYKLAPLFPVLLLDDEPERADAEAREVHGRWRQPATTLAELYVLVTRMNVAIYEGRGDDALALEAAQRKELQRAGFLRAPWLHAALRGARARAHMAALAGGGDPVPHEKALAQEAVWLAQTKLRWPMGVAAQIRAELAWRRGDGPSSEAAVVQAIEHFEAGGMTVWALSVRARTAATEAERAAAHHQLSARGVVNPSRYAGLLAPLNRS
jgi:eukaryotic-like serine/threonine-protein kinase